MDNENGHSGGDASVRHAAFKVSREALKLAGGQEPLHDRFAARIRAHFAARGEKFDVSFSNVSIRADEQDPEGRRGRSFLFDYQANLEWLAGPTTNYLLTGLNITPEMEPVPDEDIEAVAAFGALFDSLRDLIADWPEIMRD